MDFLSILLAFLHLLQSVSFTLVYPPSRLPVPPSFLSHEVSSPLQVNPSLEMYLRLFLSSSWHIHVCSGVRGVNNLLGVIFLVSSDKFLPIIIKIVHQNFLSIRFFHNFLLLWEVVIFGIFFLKTLTFLLGFHTSVHTR